MTTIRDTISLDITPSSDFETPIISMQGDYGIREIKINIKEKGTAVTLAGTETVYAYFKKPNGTTIAYVSGGQNSIISFSSGSIILSIPIQAVNISGLVGCNLSFVTTDNKKFSTQKFYIRVREVLYSDEQIENSNTKTLLEELADKVLEACEESADTAAALEDMRTNGYYEAHSPYINSDNKWMVWDSVSGAYIDSDVSAKGADGVSPTVTTSKQGSVTTITVTDKNGVHTATVSDGTNGQNGLNGADGLNGEDGFSPVIYSSKSGSVTTVTCIDKENVTNVELSDGKSAYELYIDQGGTLSLNNWLISFGFSPKYASSLSEMTNPETIYLGSNGHIYCYKESVLSVNQLPISTDAQNAVFNECGYKSGAKFTSTDGVSNMSSYPNTCVTGFIPVSTGDAVFLTGAFIDTNYDPSTSTYGSNTEGLKIIVYDSTKTKLFTRNWSYSSRTDAGAGDYQGIDCVVDNTGICTQMNITDQDDTISYIRFVFYSEEPENAGVYINTLPSTAGFKDTQINYANYSLTSSDKAQIVQEVLAQLAQSGS